MVSKKTSGVSLRGGLPEDNGLGPFGSDIAENPTADVVVVMRLSCADVVNHVQSGTRTAMLAISEVEVMSDEREAAARVLLSERRRERRSEERARAEEEAAERGEAPLPYDADAAAEEELRSASLDPSFTEPVVEGAPSGNVTPMRAPKPAKKPAKSASNGSGKRGKR